MDKSSIHVAIQILLFIILALYILVVQINFHNSLNEPHMKRQNILGSKELNDVGMKPLYAILSIICLLSCQNEGLAPSTNSGQKIDSVKFDSIYIDINDKTYAQWSKDKIDTLSLMAFWENFKKNILTVNKFEIINSINFPIHAIEIAEFMEACTCDHQTFQTFFEKHELLDINERNFIEYYDFVFGKELTSVLKQISSQMLLERSFDLETLEGVGYNIFPKDYGFGKNCNTDYCLKMFIVRSNEKWLITIGFHAA